MKWNVLSLTRRKALASVAAVASMNGSSSRSLPSRLIPLRKSSSKELLVKLVLTRDRFFALWRASISPHSASRLASYTLNGEQQWSKNLVAAADAPLFDLIPAGSTEVMAVSCNLGSAQLLFTRYNYMGYTGESDVLPLHQAVLAVAASATAIYATDSATQVWTKKFGGMEAAMRLAAAFHVPVIGGVKLPAVAMSAHFLGDHLVLLDHVKARAVKLFSNGQRQEGRLIHPDIEAALQKQDADVESRARALRITGIESAMTFPLSIARAASDPAHGLWVIAKLQTGLIPIIRFNSRLEVQDSLSIRVPQDSVIGDRPPGTLAVSLPTIALGFQEGFLTLASDVE